jgi:hypothetical protein
MRDRLFPLPFAAAIALLLSTAVSPCSPPLAAQVLAQAGKQRSWGEAYYLAVGNDGVSTALDQWRMTQEAGVSLNFRTDSGIEVLSDFVVPINPGMAISPSAVIQQLSLRYSPSDLVTLIVGKQRLNWGTAKIFSAIDTLEVRANPLDVRSVLTGISGIKAAIIPNDWLSLSFVLLPDDEPRWSRGAARIDFLAEDLGLDLGLGVVKYAYLDWTVTPPAAPGKLDHIAVMSDGALSAGSLVLYEETQLRWGRETGYQFPTMPSFADLGGADRPIFRGVGGAMIQVELGLSRPVTVLAEYLYNGDGLDEQESRDFASRYAAWLGSGMPAGAQVPGAFTGIGGFRRQYIAASLQEIALDRYFLVSTTGILCLDTLLARLEVSLEWDLSQESSITMTYEYLDTFSDASLQPSELLLVPFRNRLTLTFTASY